jgi:hypothetical protein
MNCPQCDIEMEVVDSGSYKGHTWYDYQCPFCDYCYSEEPDWDSMSGGHDDY